MALNCFEKLRRDSEFDIALVDFKMPDMNGVDMIRQAYKVGIAADMIIWILLPDPK